MLHAQDAPRPRTIQSPGAWLSVPVQASVCAGTFTIPSQRSSDRLIEPEGPKLVAPPTCLWTREFNLELGLVSGP